MVQGPCQWGGRSTTHPWQDSALRCVGKRRRWQVQQRLSCQRAQLQPSASRAVLPLWISYRFLVIWPLCRRRRRFPRSVGNVYASAEHVVLRNIVVIGAASLRPTMDGLARGTLTSRPPWKAVAAFRTYLRRSVTTFRLPSSTSLLLFYLTVVHISGRWQKGSVIIEVKERVRHLLKGRSVS